MSSFSMALAGISTATAPAATTDVIHEDKAQGPLTRTLLGVVAIDDAWGVMLFSLILVAAKALTGEEAVLGVLLWGVQDVLGGLLLGPTMGLPVEPTTHKRTPPPGTPKNARSNTTFTQR